MRAFLLSVHSVCVFLFLPSFPLHTRPYLLYSRGLTDPMQTLPAYVEDVPLIRAVLLALCKQIFKDHASFFPFLHPFQDEQRHCPLVPLTQWYDPGYPQTPFFRHIADGLFLWSQSGQFPLKCDPSMELEGIEQLGYDDLATPYTAAIRQIVQEIADSLEIVSTEGVWGKVCETFPFLDSIFSLLWPYDVPPPSPSASSPTLSSTSTTRVLHCLVKVEGEEKEAGGDDEKEEEDITTIYLPATLYHEFRSLLCALDPLLLSSFLGFRRTISSVFHMPPSKQHLLEAFNAIHNEDAKNELTGFLSFLPSLFHFLCFPPFSWW